MVIFNFFLAFQAYANNSPFLPPQDADIEVTIHNAILAKVNGNTISVLDVMKRMDMLFHRSYPGLIDSKSSRYQFYQSNWQQVLNDMIHTELILADAQSKELKITDGEIREEIEAKFGPNIMLTLDRIGITFDEAWKMVKNEMIVQRMNWFFINSKALQAVTPKLVRQAYEQYCIEHPTKDEWAYQVITVRGEEKSEEFAKKIYEYLIEKKPDILKPLDELSTLTSSFPGCSFQISPEYKSESKNISELHLQVLTSLSEKDFSKPILQNSRFDKKALYRIFFLKSYAKGKSASFEELASTLKEELLQKVALEESSQYLEKLRKQYGHGQNLEEKLPADFHPFVIR